MHGPFNGVYRGWSFSVVRSLKNAGMRGCESFRIRMSLG